MITPGAILIRNDAHLPATLVDGMSPFSVRWSFLADSSDRELMEERLACSGWSSFAAADSKRASAIRRAATGVDGQKMVQAALERVLAKAEMQRCNLLEIGEVKMHSFRRIHYASVLGHAHQMQAEASR